MGRVLNVDASAPGCYRTIKELVPYLVGGDTVQLGPGQYTESLVLPAGVTLRGSGSDRTFLTYPGMVIDLNASCRLENLTVTSPADFGAVGLIGDGVSITGCRFAYSLAAVTTNGTHHLVVRDCEFSGLAGNGINMCEGGSAEVHFCRFGTNERPGIYAEQAVLTVADCRFDDLATAGVEARSSRLTVQRCSLTGTYPMVTCTGSTEASLVGTSFRVSPDPGQGVVSLHCTEVARVAVHECTFEGATTYVPVASYGRSSVAITSSSFRQAICGGLAAEQSQLRVEACVFDDSVTKAARAIDQGSAEVVSDEPDSRVVMASEVADQGRLRLTDARGGGHRDYVADAQGRAVQTESAGTWGAGPQVPAAALAAPAPETIPLPAAPTRPPRTWLVQRDSFDPAHLATIAEALEQAIPGDVIEVGPGRYEEVVELTEGVTLRGAGAQATVLIGEAPLLVTDDGAVVEDLSLDVTGEGAAAAGLFGKGPVIRRCQAIGAQSAAILVNDCEDGVVEDCVFDQFQGNSVRFEGGTATIRATRFGPGRFAAVFVNAGHALIDGCTFTGSGDPDDPDETGVLAMGGLLEIRDTTFSRYANPAVGGVGETTEVRVTDSTFTDMLMSGVRVGDRVSLSVTGCRTERCGDEAAIMAEGDATATVSGVTTSSTPRAVWAFDRATVQVGDVRTDGGPTEIGAADDATVSVTAGEGDPVLSTLVVEDRASITVTDPTTGTTSTRRAPAMDEPDGPA